MLAPLLALLTLCLPLPAALADASARLSRGFSFCGEPVPLNQGEIFEAVDQNLLLLSEARSRVWMSLRRAGRFKPLVEGALRQAGLPDDLKYIPFVLTGFAPDHSGGGRGLWRLDEKTAKALGLRLDKDVDERLDPTASTAAAVKKLAALKTAYGSWTSAAAAFVIGDEVYQKAVSEAGGEKNFYKLYFPGHQDQSAAMVLAGKLIFGHPAAFGYNQAEGRAWPPFSGRRVVVKKASTARALAAGYKKDYKTFRDANPHLISGTVPKGVAVNVP
jgi:hypothetical protein